MERASVLIHTQPKGSDDADHLIQRDHSREPSNRMPDADDDQSWAKYTNFHML